MNEFQADAATPPPHVRSLMVSGAGVCCLVGYYLNAAVCCFRANMDHFQESEFFCDAGEAIVVSKLPGDLQGHERLQSLIEYAVNDCAHYLQELHSIYDPLRTALIILSPDKGRAHSDSQLYTDLTLDAIEHLGQGHLRPGEYTLSVLPAGRGTKGHSISH